MRAFDSYLMVDWSAAATPKRGNDSIWIALYRAEDGLVLAVNPTTRAEAVSLLGHLLASEADLGRRVLAGFDFPFGYPTGTAKALTGRADWAALWRLICDRISDRPDNANNRFEVAAEFNRAFDGLGPFWGRPSALQLADLPERGRDVAGAHPPKRRLVEQRAKTAQETWKLFTTGSVGSQVLMGLPALSLLRADHRLSHRCEIWPFETGLAAPSAPVCLAEVYPSLLPVVPAPDEIKDRAQVRVLVEAMAAADAAGDLAPMFCGPDNLSRAERHAIETEEAWILGAGFEKILRRPL